MKSRIAVVARKVSANLFVCFNAREKRICDNRLNIRRDALEKRVLSGLRNQLMELGLYKVFEETFYKELSGALLLKRHDRFRNGRLRSKLSCDR